MWLGFVMMIVNVPVLLFRAWVFSMLWIWFATPVFNLPALNMATSVGLCTLIGFFTSWVCVDTATLKLELLGKSRRYIYIHAAICSILWSIMTLVTGFVAHLFM